LLDLELALDDEDDDAQNVVVAGRQPGAASGVKYLRRQCGERDAGLQDGFVDDLGPPELNVQYRQTAHRG